MGGWETLALKLILTPLLVGGASLAARRWGSEVGGWLVGIPFTSAPITFFLAIGPGAHRLQGGELAISVLRGLLLGLVAFAGFFLTIALYLEPAGIALAFAAAIVVALAVQAATLFTGRRLALA